MKLVVKFLLLTLLVLAAGLAIAWQQYQDFLKTPLNLSEPYVLTVPKGSSYNRVVAQLVDAGLIASPLWMKVYGRESDNAPRIRAGEYRVEVGATPVDLVALMVSGRSIQYSVTLIEGSTVREALALLKSDPVLEHTTGELNDADIMKVLGIERPSLEGLLLAETYHFERGTSDLDILRRAHQLLQDTLNTAWEARPKALPYESAYEALIMASIVEKETGRPNERPEIAGVFVRRLNKGMKLQTDPTVIYGMGERYDGNIRRADLRRPTPYNTYVIKGLPPTPIALVGAEAIRAALNPADGKALYFVAKGDGSHQFSATLAEHNRAVREYQLQRRKDYRSSP